MKAITLWQPWASLLACGAKQYETRSWPTAYRGPIAIHAATKKSDDATKDISGIAIHTMIQALRTITSKLATTTMYLPLELLPRGCIVATAELVACWRIAEQVDGGVWVQEVITGQRKHIVTLGNEGHFGDFTPGRYALEFANMTMLSEPIPAKGGQRIWNWEGNVL